MIVDALLRAEYIKWRSNVLSLVTSQKEELDNKIYFGNTERVVINDESIFYIHHYLQRLRPPGVLKKATHGWNNIKKLVIEASRISLDIETVQDSFTR